MKTRIMSNLKKKVLLVDGMPEDCFGYGFNEFGSLEFFTQEDKDHPPTKQAYYKLDVGKDWRPISKLSEVTEEQILTIMGGEFCDRCPLENKGVYGAPGGYVAGCEGSKCDETRETIQESFLSALESENVFTELPVVIVENREYSDEEMLDLYEKAEANVFTPNQTLIFIEQ